MRASRHLPPAFLLALFPLIVGTSEGVQKVGSVPPPVYVRVRSSPFLPFVWLNTSECEEGGKLDYQLKIVRQKRVNQRSINEEQVRMGKMKGKMTGAGRPSQWKP